MINMIAAVDEEMGIGKDGSIPWQIPYDLARFKVLTMDGVLIMGRKTWDSLPQKPLKGRDNFVITSGRLGLSDDDYKYYVNHCGLEIFDCPYNALLFASDWAADTKEIWIIGGESIYKALLPFTQRLYLTRVRGKYNCDTFFPESPKEFVLTDSEVNGSCATMCRFEVYERKQMDNKQRICK